MWNVLAPIIGTLINKIGGIIDQKVEDKDLANKLKAELALELSRMDYSVLEKELESKTKVLVSEATGHSWLQRNWRPILMLVFTFIVAWNYAVVPILSLFAPQFQPLPIPPDMWGLLKLGVGGYVFSRSAEKVVTAWKMGSPSKRSDRGLPEAIKETFLKDGF